MPSAIISDTSCIITLELIDQLTILKKLFGKVFITEIIAKEYSMPLPAFIEISNPSNVKYQKILESLVDKGEASAIALCMDQEDPLLIIDDYEGRRLARNIGINITGTLGLLIESKKLGYISKLSPVLADIKNKTKFRIKEELIQEALRIVGE